MNISSIDGSALIAGAALIFGVVAFVVLCIVGHLRQDPRWDKFDRFH